MEYVGWRSVASGENYTLNIHTFTRRLHTETAKRNPYLPRKEPKIESEFLLLIAMTTKTLSFDWPYISVCKKLITKDISL